MFTVFEHQLFEEVKYEKFFNHSFNGCYYFSYCCNCFSF